MKFSGLLIGSDNPERLAGYYRRLFGDPAWEQGGYTGWQFETAAVMIGPHDAVHGANAEPGRIIWNLESPDVPGEFQRLREAGAQVVREPYHPGDGPDTWIATFTDPDGNYFQLGSPM